MTKASLTIVAVLAASPALADRQPVVDAAVTSVVFDAGTQTRAVAGDDDGTFLAIERIARGRVTGQTWITELPIGRSRVPLTEFKNLRLTSLAGTSLAFELAPRLKGARRAIQCTAVLSFERGQIAIRSTSCTQDDKPYGAVDAAVPVQPASASTDQLKAASAACNEAFPFASERTKCLDMTVDAIAKSKFPSSAIKTVAACAGGFSFSSSRTWCIETASRSLREPVELIRYCTEQHNFESEQKACLTKFAKTP